MEVVSQVEVVVEGAKFLEKEGCERGLFCFLGAIEWRRGAKGWVHADIEKIELRVSHHPTLRLLGENGQTHADQQIFENGEITPNDLAFHRAFPSHFGDIQ